jgi:hypothetical protein
VGRRPGFYHPYDFRANHYPWPRFGLPRRHHEHRRPRAGAKAPIPGKCGIRANTKPARPAGRATDRARRLRRDGGINAAVLADT